MIIQLNTDNHVDGNRDLFRDVETELSRSLARFAAHLTRIEVHFHDDNASKSGVNDKRCTLEARMAGHDPIAVTNTADTVRGSFVGARDKLARLLEKRLAKLRPPKGRDPFNGVLTPQTDDL
ncbi:MAG: HPF/RaiA family ribosome-associated protein [Gemmatimonadaceae bacterium]|nr:HPF/RaiA family ribosome-associated protein [Gemmatimonadaceae bacterium]